MASKPSCDELRKMLGMTQLEMADFLGLERTTWSSIELGKRNIPRKIIARYQLLYNSVTSGAVSKSKTDLATEQKELKVARNKLVPELKYTLQKTKWKLQDMEKKFAASSAALQNLSKVIITSESGWKKRQERMLGICTYSNKENMDRNNAIAQLELRLQIVGLEAQIVFLEKGGG